MKASFAQQDFQGDVVFETKGIWPSASERRSCFPM